ncbi:MAG: nuclear transport factor 2 family protein [Xanthomonadales bacterium]|nr:nuclear transport factor 2 family protein [Xanthomonadales bacterium]
MPAGRAPAALLLWLVCASASGNHADDFRSACLATNHDYVAYRDRGEVDAYAGLFTQDARFVFQRTLEGREAIGKAMAQRWSESRTRHWIQPIRIAITGEKTAEGLVYVKVYRATRDGTTGPVPFEGPLIAEYHDQYRYVDGNCLIESREVKLVFASP